VRVAWIGLGNMGLPMAANAVAAGHQVVGFDVRDDAMAALVERGGHSADSAAAAARDADLVHVMVLDGPQVESVTGGTAGAFSTAGPGTVVARSQALTEAKAGRPQLLESIQHGVALYPTDLAVLRQALVDATDAAREQLPIAGFDRAARTQYNGCR